MSKKVIVLYDTTSKECDKLWVAEGLQQKGYQVKVLYCLCTVFSLEQKGKLGKALAICVITLQCIIAAMISNTQDTIFCWNHWTGLIMNLLYGNKRSIISYNWLTPPEHSKISWLYRKALENSNLKAVINSPNNRERILNAYEAKDINNIFYIPDVYNHVEIFQKPDVKSKSYCFMGGVENRDWNMFLKIAQRCPNISFVGVTSKSQKINENDLPDNIKMYYDLSMAEYYALMSEAYFCICFLKADRVSGLINILKAAQLGKLMMITKSEFTEIYYPEELRVLLLEREDEQKVLDKMMMISQMPQEEYEQKVAIWQNYIEREYSPNRAIEDICRMI